MKIMQAIINRMYQMSLPIETVGSIPPNNQVTKWITSHSRGTTNVRMIKPTSTNNKNFRILPIALHLFIY